jgi:alkylation response protein AidB-like acyl-CoA dehydrogenase
MYDFLLSDAERAVRDEAREMVRSKVDPEYLRRMDRDEIRFPRELYEIYASHNLLGLRFPREYGGRGMSWVADCAVQEEIGPLGMAAGCAFVMPSIVGRRGPH